MTVGREPASRSSADSSVVSIPSGDTIGDDPSCCIVVADLVAFAQCLTGVDEVVVWPQPRNM